MFLYFHSAYAFTKDGYATIVPNVSIYIKIHFEHG